MSNGARANVIIGVLASALLSLCAASALHWAAFFRTSVSASELQAAIDKMRIDLNAAADRQVNVVQRVTKVETILDIRIQGLDDAIKRLEAKIDSLSAKGHP